MKEANTFKLVKDYFDKIKIDFWIEAGTALGIYRDGQILPWDHDIDIGVWYDDLKDYVGLENYFSNKGFDVIIQKKYPFIDNIIQLKVRDNEKHNYIDIDLYLFKQKNGLALMRWINSPVGRFSGIKKRGLTTFKNFLASDKKNIISMKSLFHSQLLFLFKVFLNIHLNTSSCIYHKFPERFFLNLKPIECYGIELYISNETEKYLEHRYGINWNKPDKNFNQAGKWKLSKAREKMKMNFLKPPKFL